MIQIEGLEVSRAGRKVLDISRLTIPNRSITSVIGPSGAGKTTLLRCLSFVDVPDAGRISVGEQTYAFVAESHVRPTAPPWPFLTAVFQDLWLWDHLDLETNIRLPVSRKRSPETDSRFAQIVADLDIEHLVKRYPHQVSGGERQRAAIARALMQQPHILLLDEPTSASDVEHSYRLAELIRTLPATQGMTVVLVTHHLRFAQRVSDHVVFLDRGSVLQSGEVDLLERTTDERVRRFVSVL